MKPMVVYLYFVVFIMFNVSCRKDVVLPDIDKNISGPVDVETVQNEQYFLVLNSNKDRQYKSGSILVVGHDGTKQAAFPISSLARKMTVAGDDLLVIFDKETKKRGDAGSSSLARVELYHIGEKGGVPDLLFKKAWALQSSDCIPWNVVAEKDYPYFAVACAGGGLMMGELKETREDSTLDLVRQYGGTTKRAMYLDSKNGLLFAFPTDIGMLGILDASFEDKLAWDEASNSEKPEPNEIPDFIEKSKTQRDSVSRTGSSHQFILYDIAKEAQEVKEAKNITGRSFQFKSVDDYKELITSERRWTYFLLKSDNPEENKKFYRTNFWSAVSDPATPGTFYLSHRGSAANNIIKVTLKDGFREPNKKTSDLLTFEQVFGFKGTNQHNSSNNLTNFRFFSEDTTDFLLIDNFSEKESSKDQRYSLILSPLGKATDFYDEVSSTKLTEAYFGFSVGADNSVLASSYDGDSVTLFTIKDKKLVKTKDIN